LFWTKINDRAIAGSIWEKIDDVEIDTDLIITAFEAAPAPTKAKVEGPLPSSQSRRRIALLDPIRSRAINIMLSRFKFSNEEIASAILQIRNCFTHDQLAALLANLPNPEELNLVKEYTGESILLGNAEKLALVRVEDIGEHLDLRLLVRSFDSLISDVEKPLALLIDSWTQISKSKPLMLVFAALLAMGNLLNLGTSRGGANCFKIQLLPSLGDIRSKTKDQTALSVFVEHTLTKLPEAGKFVEDLEPFDPAKKLDLDFLKTTLSTLSGRINKLKQGAKAAQQRVASTSSTASDYKLNFFMNDNF
jgi:hypothetical protein